MFRQLVRSHAAPLSAIARTQSLPSRAIVSQRWQRFYSIKPETAATPSLPNIDPSKLTVTKTTTPKELIPQEQLLFGKTFTGENSPKKQRLCKPECSQALQII